jgi:hypothetical protein
MSTAPADEPTQAAISEAAENEAATSEASTGAAPTGEAPTGEAPTGAAPTGEAPTGEAPSGQTYASETEHTADAMKDQLQKDVASWREGRSEGSNRQATELSVAVARSIVPPTTARMKRAKPVTPEAKPATTEKKPFGMSYDGTSRSDYIKLMIARGAR